MMKPQRIQLGSWLLPYAPKHSQLLPVGLCKELMMLWSTLMPRKLNSEVGGALEHHADRLADIAVLHALKVDANYSTGEATS